jgi:drug/metabolite transporter (DMT)-like permease
MLGVSGQFLLTWAYRRAMAGVLASVDYLALPYAALLGFVFFHEVPSGADRGGIVDCDGPAEIMPRLDRR